MAIPKRLVAPRAFPIALTEKQIAYALLAIKEYADTGDCEADEHTQVIIKLASALALNTIYNKE